jgi:HrpA-like RNA helicase
VADLLDEEPLPRRATINPLNGKSFSPKYYHMLERRRQLPVWTMKEEFICELARRQVVVLHGDAPGSGKTTQVCLQVMKSNPVHFGSHCLEDLPCQW